jgi:hypothetical protein
MNVRAVCEGGFTLPLPVADAVALFTPEGERRWAGPDWDPQYAIAESARDDSAPGTVFSTESDGGRATWIVLERRDDGMRYARIAPDRIAGTVDVRCAPAPGGGTSVTVSYDVTSLGEEGAAFVRELESGFGAFMDSWREEIVQGLT